uniref:C2H2-type domain-containing protein n=1 Tax=Pogona vitticeps TaxID=103695 RepID=A0ABM5FFI4_9SAUR
MEGEAPLKDEQKQLQAGANQKEDDADEAFLLLLEGLEDLQDEGKEKEVRLQGTLPERGEEENENCWEGNESLWQNQADQRRDRSHRYPRGVASEDEMGKTTNWSISAFQISDYQENIPLRKSPLKCPTCHAEINLCQCLEERESFRWRPEDTRFHKVEKHKRFSSDLEAPQPMHSEEKVCTCIECGMSFKRSSELESHQSIHTGQKAYKSHECGQAFRHNSHLQEHQRIHTDEKPHECKECGRSFSQIANFIIHQQTHSGEKPYICEKCGKCFSNSSNFKVHHYCHSEKKPYSCKECGKRFNRSSVFHVHQRIHTGEKPHQCIECGKKFRHKSSLVIHQRIHSGEKPYHCEVCGRSFRQLPHFQRHKHSQGRSPIVVNNVGGSSGNINTFTQEKNPVQLNQP